MSKSQPDSLFPEPLQWYRFAGGTYWNIQSKSPMGFTVRCVTADGTPANPDPQTHLGHELPVGHCYRAVNYNTHPASESAIYDSLGEAKEACELFLMHGSFPPDEDEGQK